MFTQSSMALATYTASFSVHLSAYDILNAPFINCSGMLIASSTNDGLGLPLLQADPVLQRIAFSASIKTNC